MSEIQVNTINEYTGANGVTIDGVLLKDGSINANGTGRKNYIINGNFDIWQRGTSFTATGYTADRWNAIVSGTGTTTISQQSFTLGQTDVPNEPKYYLRIAKSSGATSGDYLSSKNESVRTFAGQATVISFYAKASAATTLTPTIRQNFGTGGSPSSVNDAVKSDISVTTSWQKFTITHTFDSISGKTLGTANDDNIELFFNIQNATGDSVDFAQFQWEKGSVATDFEVRPIGEELNLCARYYQKLISPRVNFSFDNAGLASSSSLLEINIPLINEMRIDSDGTTGTITKSGDMAIYAFASNGNNLSGTPINYFRISKTQLQIGLNKSSADISSGSHYNLSAVNDAYFDIDVEL